MKVKSSSEQLNSHKWMDLKKEEDHHLRVDWGPETLRAQVHEVRYIFLVPTRGHLVYTLTNCKKKHYIIHTHKKQEYKPCFP